VVECCSDCKFFLVDEKPTGNGVCRRFPPQVVAAQWVTGQQQVLVGAQQPPIVTGVTQISATYPGMNGDNGWCGEFFRRELRAEAEPFIIPPRSQ
jgi:hypothetical protein